MSRYQMNAEKALAILNEAADARLRWGKQASIPYSMQQIMEAIELVKAEGWLGKPQINDEDVTKLKRQLAAANARVARLSKNGGHIAEQQEE